VVAFMGSSSAVSVVFQLESDLLTALVRGNIHVMCCIDSRTFIEGARLIKSHLCRLDRVFRFHS
jgi:hypothetical protein